MKTFKVFSQELSEASRTLVPGDFVKILLWGRTNIRTGKVLKVLGDTAKVAVGLSSRVIDVPVDKLVLAGDRIVSESVNPDMYTVTAPSFWATVFFNDDRTGFDRAELRAIDEFADSLDGIIIDASEEPFFMKYHDAYDFWPYASECLEYTVRSF